jgi:hypothetical protein
LDISAYEYYAYLSVENVLEYNDCLLCTVKAPVVRDVQAYQLFFHAFAIANEDKYVTLDVLEDFILIPTTEDIFAAQNCFGLKPHFCTAGVRWKKSTLPCYLGLATRDETMISKCPLTISSSVGQKVHHTVDNIFAVQASAVTYHHQCKQEIPDSGKIENGVYLIKIDPGCTLSTDKWYIKGLTFCNTSIHREWTPTPIELKFLKNPLNFSEGSIAQYKRLNPMKIPQYQNLEKSHQQVVSEIDQIQPKMSKHQIPWYVYVMIAILA